MLGRIYAIGINTFREAVRDRVLYGVLGFATAVLVFTLALAELSLEQERRVVLDVGLASISVFSVVVAVFLGSSLLYKEIERKTLYIILPRPIRRWEFLVGKYLGILLTAVVFITIMGSIQLWVTSIQADAPVIWIWMTPIGLLAVLGLALFKARDRTAVLVPWSLLAVGCAAALCSTTDVELGVVLASLVLYAEEVMVLASVAVLFSSFSTPFLTGAFTLGVWIVGRSADDMVAMKGDAIGPEIKTMLAWMAEVIPNFNLFVPGRHTLTTISEAHGGPWMYVLSTSGQAVLYSVLILALASFIFRRRDFL